jgi:transcriptional regulator with XRE-family HTH domain
MNKKQLGERLAQARRDAGMTQRDVEAATGIDQTIVARMENGQRVIAALTALQLADLYRVPVAALLETATS